MSKLADKFKKGFENFADKTKADFKRGQEGKLPDFKTNVDQFKANLKKHSQPELESIGWQAKYLGGYPDYPAAKSVKVYITKQGIAVNSSFLNKPLFSMPWDYIQDVGQDLVHKQENSALGGMAAGLGLMSVANGAGLAGYALQSAGQSSKSNVTEHYLEVHYLIKGIKGVVVFEFKSFFWKKRPVLEVIANINKTRIENSKQV